VTRAALAAVLGGALGACGAAPPSVASCADNLEAVYVTPDGARWMLLDGGATLEAYPLFPDAGGVSAPAGMVVAPRVLDLHRATPGAPQGQLAGVMRRRYTRGGDACEAHAPAHVVACRGATLELVLADPAAPLAVAPCAYPAAAPSRREVWTRD